MKEERRIEANALPGDWRYYTLTYPVARYRNFTPDDIIREMIACDRHFYSMPRILRRVVRNAWRRRWPLITLIGGLSYRGNLRLSNKTYSDFLRRGGGAPETRP